MRREELIKYSPAFAQDFDKFLVDNYQNVIPHTSIFYTFPSEFQIGAFIKFLHENTIEIEISYPSIEEIEDSIVEGIKTYQNIAGHYS